MEILVCLPFLPQLVTGNIPGRINNQESKKPRRIKDWYAFQYRESQRQDVLLLNSLSEKKSNDWKMLQFAATSSCLRRKEQQEVTSLFIFWKGNDITESCLVRSLAWLEWNVFQDTGSVSPGQRVASKQLDQTATVVSMSKHADYVCV